MNNEFNFSKLNIYLDKIKNKRLLIFLTNTGEVENFSELIDNFSKDYSECEFLLKENFDIKRANVNFINELCEDIKQVLYISNYAQIIVGKQSEIFSIVQSTYQSTDNKKTFISYDANAEIEIKQQVENLIKPKCIIVWFTPRLNDSIRYKFKDYDRIAEVYSSGYQDLFALSLTKNKTKNKTYLEISSADATHANATYTLSKNFGWAGVSAESDIQFYENWKNYRPADKVMFCDVSQVDYKKLLQENYKDTVIDYLNIDVNDQHDVENILKSIPHEKYKFSVITIKILSYTTNKKNTIREFLTKMGYTLILQDAIFPWVYGDGVPVDDWWVDLNLVDIEVALDMKSRSHYTHQPVHLLFK